MNQSMLSLLCQLVRQRVWSSSPSLRTRACSKCGSKQEVMSDLSLRCHRSLQDAVAERDRMRALIEQHGPESAGMLGYSPGKFAELEQKVQQWKQLLHDSQLRDSQLSLSTRVLDPSRDLQPEPEPTALLPASPLPPAPRI